MWTILEQILATERVHRRAGSGDFARPFLHERPIPEEAAPVVVSNAKGAFVTGVRSQNGIVRAGFAEVPPESEPQVLSALFHTLWDLSVVQQWPNRCTSLKEAPRKLASFGFDVKCVVVAPNLLVEACGGEDQRLDSARHPQVQQAFGRGYAAEVDGVRILVASELPAGTALALALPPLVGTYVRTDHHLALMVYRADRALVLVRQSDEQPCGLSSLSRQPTGS